MSHSLRTHGQLSSARPLASMAVADRAPAPCRFVRQRLERPPTRATRSGNTLRVRSDHATELQNTARFQFNFEIPNFFYNPLHVEPGTGIMTLNAASSGVPPFAPPG